MTKYSKERTIQICEYIETGEYLIKDICEKVGISRETFNQWKKTKTDFSDAIKKAEEAQLAKVKLLARKGLNKLLEGDQFTEVTSELKSVDGQDEMVETKRVTKRIQPNSTAVIFALKNTDSENFADKKEVDVNLTNKSAQVIKPPSADLEDIINKD